MRRALLVAFVISLAAPAQNPPEPTAEQRAQMVQLKHISVNGTRLPKLSILRLIGLKAGDQVNEASVNAACRRLQSTGLIKSVDYQYLLYPDKTDVDLVLTVVDEPKLVPITIEPNQDAEPLWAALKAVDPIFTETLPPNEKAISFYAHNLDVCLKRLGRTDEYVTPRLEGKPGEEPDAVVFEVKKYKN